MKENQKKYLILILTIGIFAMILYFIGMTPERLLALTRSYTNMLADYAKDHYTHAVITYELFGALIVICGLPIIIPHVLIGGSLFGIVLGTLYATMGCTIGAVISFLVFRYLIRSTIQRWYGKKFAYLKHQIEHYGPYYIIMLHYLSVVPLTIINGFAALTTISLPTFICITFLGSFPPFLLYAFAGQKLSHVTSFSDLFSPTIFGALAVLIGITCIALLIKKRRAR